MENDNMGLVEKTLKAIRFHKRLSFGLMFVFTIVTALNFTLFLNNLDPPNWFMLIFCGFFCCLFIRNIFKCFRDYQAFSTEYTILKTQGLEALSAHMRKGDGKP